MSDLRVVFDGRRLQDRPLTGVGRALAGILSHVAAAADVTVLVDRRRFTPSAEGARVVALPGLGPLPETAWLQGSVAAWLSRHPGQVFHGTFNAIPVLSRARSVVSIYDLSWEHHPEDLGPGHRVAFAAQARWAAHHADLVLTPSQFTAASVIDTYRIPADRVRVVPLSVPPVFGPPRAGEVSGLLDRLGVRIPYVVAVGGARRRGLPVAVQAWRAATADAGRDRPQLVVVGTEHPPAQPGVVYAGPLDDLSWAQLLAAAEALCYPTRFEGFGMPALEALASGTPVVCAPVASLPEILGDVAAWAASPETPDVAAALAGLLADDAGRDRLRRAGLERVAAGPGWPEIATLTLDAYRRAAR